MRIDTLLTNARVLTLDDERPWAHAIATLGGRVVGLDGDLEGVEPRNRVDLRGATVVPGFNDAHNHMAGFGLSLDELRLSSPPMHSLDDVYDAVAERAAAQPEGTWVVGSGYDQNKLGGRHPGRRELDRVAPGHMVWLKHTSGHMAVVGSAVLRAIGDASVPEGGVVVRDERGEPTGLLQEQAQLLVQRLVYPTPVEALVSAIGRASERYLREGITSCTEAGVGGGWVGQSPVEVAAYQEARDRGALGVRVRLMVALEALHALSAHAEDGFDRGLDLGIRTGLGDARLRLGAVKIFADGSLLGRTAALTEGFADEPDNRGYLQWPADELRRAVIAAHDAGWQVATHALGDRAIDIILDAYEEAQRRRPRPGARHRVEHCGVARPDQLERLAGLRVIPVPQAPFIGQIGDAMLTALGPERGRWCYRQRSFLDAGLTLPGSSDRPVVAGAPLLGIHDLVNQKTMSGADYNPQEALTPLQALRAYTLGSAYAAFEELDKGSVTVGKLADLAVLSDDPTRVSPEGIKDIEVLATFVGGWLGYDGMGLAW